MLSLFIKILVTVWPFLWSVFIGKNITFREALKSKKRHLTVIVMFVISLFFNYRLASLVLSDLKDRAEYENYKAAVKEGTLPKALTPTEISLTEDIKEPPEFRQPKNPASAPPYMQPPTTLPTTTAIETKAEVASNPAPVATTKPKAKTTTKKKTNTTKKPVAKKTTPKKKTTTKKKQDTKFTPTEHKSNDTFFDDLELK